MKQSQASLAFAEAIKDAENLLAHFDKLNTKPPPPENEVLKRAGLVMAMTAWETYVEDRVAEAAASRVSGIPDIVLSTFVQTRLKEEIKKLHNPNSDKTIQLFEDYAGVNVSTEWKWSHVDSSVAKQRLNGYLKLRGDVVHRSALSRKDRRRRIQSRRRTCRRP
ncbi:MAG: HEPN domain-containing protein [Pseudomonadota bacterium]